MSMKGKATKQFRMTHFSSVVITQQKFNKGGAIPDNEVVTWSLSGKKSDGTV